MVSLFWTLLAAVSLDCYNCFVLRHSPYHFSNIIINQRPEYDSYPIIHSKCKSVTCGLNMFPWNIDADDMWSLWSVVAVSAMSGQILESRTKVGRALSGPVAAMVLSALLTNVGILPRAGSNHLITMQATVVKLATPMLLLGADLGQIFRETGQMMKAFLVGTVGTLLGASIGFYTFANKLTLVKTLAGNGIGRGDDWKIAGALTAKNIGGGLNYMAVVDALKPSPASVSLGIAVDNLLGLLYFPIVSWIGSIINRRNAGKPAVDSHNNFETLRGKADSTTLIQDNDQTYDNDLDRKSSPGWQDEVFLRTMVLGLCIVAISEKLSSFAALRGLIVPSVALSSVITITLGSIFPVILQPYAGCGEMIGKVLLLIFCSCIGSSTGDLLQTFKVGGKATIALIAFDVVLYSVHLITLFSLGRLLKLDPRDLLLASNANIGNAATASSYAIAMNWSSRLLPAVLVGNFGNFVGTFAGLWLSSTVLRSFSHKT